MIYVIAPGGESSTAQLLLSALQRSCGLGAASLGSIGLLNDQPDNGEPAVHVFVHPREEWTSAIIRLLQTKAKVLLLGRLTTGLAQHLQVELAHEWPDNWALGTLCPPAPAHGIAQSTARVCYPSGQVAVAGQRSVMTERAFRRYDYADEWNNLGYGAITADGTCWSLSQHARVGIEQELARIHLGEHDLCSYAGLWDMPASSAMWFNRAAGPIDSQEWRLVEDFLSCHRGNDLPCVPVLAEVPFGFDSAVTMRLDCDEDVESARELWRLYQAEQVPFSLALHARVLSDVRHLDLPRAVLASGGALLSHTATHAPNWGGSYETAFHEGRVSADVIEAGVGHRVRYAVSPFHHTPDYARAGLADAGYHGCVGGIIHNDPDFLMARAGIPPGSGAGFVGHSQQCMLHGECMLADGDPLDVFKQAFDLAKRGGAFFGFLDHPFSERYAYGWSSEEQRVNAHHQLIHYIKGHGGQVFWANEDDALDFLSGKSRTTSTWDGHGWRIRRPSLTVRHPLAVRFKSQLIPVKSEALIT